MQIDQTNRVLLATAAVLAIATLIRLGQSSQAPEAMWSTSAVTETQVRAISFKKPEVRAPGPGAGGMPAAASAAAGPRESQGPSAGAGGAAPMDQGRSCRGPDQVLAKTDV